METEDKQGGKKRKINGWRGDEEKVENRGRN